MFIGIIVLRYFLIYFFFLNTPSTCYLWLLWSPHRECLAKYALKWSEFGGIWGVPNFKQSLREQSHLNLIRLLNLICIRQICSRV